MNLTEYREQLALDYIHRWTEVPSYLKNVWGIHPLEHRVVNRSVRSELNVLAHLKTGIYVLNTHINNEHRSLYFLFSQDRGKPSFERYLAILDLFIDTVLNNEEGPAHE